MATATEMRMVRGTASMAAWPAVDLRGVRLDEGADGFHRSWIMLFPEGRYQHPTYGKLDFSRKTLSEIKHNFDDGAREIEIAIDRDHKASSDDSRAMGWFERLELREGHGDTPAGLWGLVRWTPLGLSDIRDQVYRYFSPEFRETYENQLTHRKYQNVLIGGALTNRPFLKAMHAIQLAEVSHRPWSQVDKDCLPRSAFLDQGDPDHPSTWRLPVYEGTGPKDAGGRYTRRGALNINGVRAALAAIGGARQSKPMTGVPAGTRAKLERWMARYGASASESSAAAKQASERTGQRTRSRSLTSSRGKDSRRRDDGMTPMGKTRSNAALKAVDDDLDELDLDDDGGEGFAFGDNPDDGEEYDDGEDGADDGAVDSEEDTHGPVTVKSHKHGKYAAHAHHNDGDHSDAPLAEDEGDDGGGEQMASAGSRSRKASESRGHSHAGRGRMLADSGSSRHGREPVSAEVRQLREELASMRYQLYEGEVGKQLDAWKSNTFQFRESPKAAPKNGRIALSRVFSEKYRAFMLKRAIRLSEGDRAELNDLVETALSTAIVDLSSRGVSYDMEGRRTVKGADRNRGAADSDRLQERAEQLLAEQGKTLSELTEAQQLALYERAAKEVGYK